MKDWTGCLIKYHDWIGIPVRLKGKEYIVYWVGCAPTIGWDSASIKKFAISTGVKND